MKRQIFPTASKYRRRTRREFGGETVEYIIVILAVVVIGGGLMGFGNQVSGQTEDTGFETPTKPHGILGRLKGLFGKFRK